MEEAIIHHKPISHINVCGQIAYVLYTRYLYT